MNIRAAVTLGLGVVLAGLAVYAVNQKLNQSGREVVVRETPFAVTPVVVAANTIAFGSHLDRTALRVASWPQKEVPEGAFKTVEEIIGDGKEPRVALRTMAAGEPVLPTKITGFGGRASMSTLLPEGKRAFTIRVNDVSGVAGFLLPGDRVDILLTRQVENGDREDQITDVILQNIVVRGIDQIADEDRNKPTVVRAITVEATPEEAQKLALAQQVGRLSLALRNVASVDTAVVRPVRVSDLSSANFRPAPPVDATAEQKTVVKATRPASRGPRPVTVRVRRGVDAETVTLGG
jgi:pilus assembly protein CpaB